MTGPEHYREAERLIADVTDEDGTTPAAEMYRAGWAAETIAIAQVHATLALAAATAHPAYREGVYTEGQYGSAMAEERGF